VIGDYCLDIYWFADLSRSEESLETGLMTRPVREQRCSLGGAGNVVSNLVALGCRAVSALGVLGDDPWGREMLRLLQAQGARTDGLLVQRENWATLAYNKPYLAKAETHRFDFGNFNVLSDAVARDLLGRLRALIPQVDGVVVNQQVRQGIHSPALRQGLVALMAEFPERTFVVDSRHYSESYTGAVMKINDHEAARLCGVVRGRGERVLREEALNAADQLFGRLRQPVVVTRGSRGLVVRDAGGLWEIPGLQVLGPMDPVGAGDSVLAGLSLGLAVGCPPAVAAQLGNLAAGVTVQKLDQTGTASPEEIRAIGGRADYVYRPELAEDPRRAQLLPGTEIEVVTALPPGLRIRLAIFDHDGTLSTLREGWEKVMEPMMVRAILGPRYESAHEALYHRVVEAVRAYIEQTTGIQTLAQMQGLVEMVRRFECVPAGEVLDAFGYKRIYNDALMRGVRRRIEKLQRGELAVEDFLIKNALPLLRRLHAAGVRMFLASGTDQDDVVTEARAMGYADLFAGGICGSVGDVTREAKRLVLERILQEIGPGAVAGLATFGDGPVEIRETVKRGGLAIGVASDEVRRFGLNAAKRSRLIKAGADIVVADFSQLDPLLAVLGVDGSRAPP
jgi:rfaE bifunctional protein kinase chain/domain